MATKKKINMTIQVNSDEAFIALKEMAKKRQIKIISEIDLNSPALPGNPMSLKEFRAWMAEAENSPSISLKEFQKRWALKKKKLLKAIASESAKKPKTLRSKS